MISLLLKNVTFLLRGTPNISICLTMFSHFCYALDIIDEMVPMSWTLFSLIFVVAGIKKSNDFDQITWGKLNYLSGYLNCQNSLLKFLGFLL